MLAQLAVAVLSATTLVLFRDKCRNDLREDAEHVIRRLDDASEKYSTPEYVAKMLWDGEYKDLPYISDPVIASYVATLAIRVDATDYEPLLNYLTGYVDYTLPYPNKDYRDAVREYILRNNDAVIDEDEDSDKDDIAAEYKSIKERSNQIMMCAFIDHAAGKVSEPVLKFIDSAIPAALTEHVANVDPIPVISENNTPTPVNTLDGLVEVIDSFPKDSPSQNTPTTLGRISVVDQESLQPDTEVHQDLGFQYVNDIKRILGSIDYDDLDSIKRDVKYKLWVACNSLRSVYYSSLDPVVVRLATIETNNPKYSVYMTPDSIAMVVERDSKYYRITVMCDGRQLTRREAVDAFIVNEVAA